MLGAPLEPPPQGAGQLFGKVTKGYRRPEASGSRGAVPTGQGQGDSICATCHSGVTTEQGWGPGLPLPQALHLVPNHSTGNCQPGPRRQGCVMLSPLLQITLYKKERKRQQRDKHHPTPPPTGQ